MAVVGQAMIVRFTGFLGVFYCDEQQNNLLMTLVIAGFSSILGGSFPRWLWKHM